MRKQCDSHEIKMRVLDISYLMQRFKRGKPGGSKKRYVTQISENVVMGRHAKRSARRRDAHGMRISKGSPCHPRSASKAIEAQRAVGVSVFQQSAGFACASGWYGLVIGGLAFAVHVCAKLNVCGKGISNSVAALQACLCHCNEAGYLLNCFYTVALFFTVARPGSHAVGLGVCRAVLLPESCRSV